MSRNVYDGKIAGLYDLEDTLGRGHFAVVKLARHVFTGEKVAVKVIDKTKLDEVSRAHLFQEVRCMKLVQHPNVVRLYEVIDTQTKLYLILELGDGGDMYDHIMKHEGGLDEGSARNYFRQIVHAIGYCHRLHVVHRDLKPENVVFFRKLGMVKLTDFGFSNRFCPGQKLETSCGSLAYSAPEILLGDSYDAPAVDVWSLGVILYMLVCGNAPFQEANDSETLTMIMDCKYSIPPHVSETCTSLIRRMLIRDPERRATLEQITADPWLAADEGEGEREQPAEYLPLVSRELVSDEDHAHIIQKMVTGNIASQEDIQDSLDQNVYNHISATYFLLAERKLRALRQERAKLMVTTAATTPSSVEQVSDLAALAISPRNANTPECLTRDDSRPRTVESLLSPQEKRKALALPRSLDDFHPCRCLALALPSSSSNSSSLRDVTATATNIDGDTAKVATLVANPASEVAASTTTQPPPGWPPVQLSAVSRFKATPNNRRLHSVRSSPQLTLNEIHEEGESEGEVAVRTSPLAVAHPATTGIVAPLATPMSSPRAGKYERRRCYAAKARSTASCSSSDATSDEDATDPRHLKRKADKLKRGGPGGWRGARRPGADEDDDEAAPGGSRGGTAGGNDGPTPSGNAQERDAPASPASGGSRPPGSTSSPRQQTEGGDSPAISSMSSRDAPSLGGGGESSSPPSPIPSPFHAAATITSLRQSKTLGQLNRFIAVSSSSSPPPSMLSLEDKENTERRSGRGTLGPRCPGPLSHLLHMRRPSRWRPTSRPASASSSLTSSRLSVVSATAPGTESGQIPGCLLTPSAPSGYKQGLARLLKHTPALGPVKRWDMNRNGLDVSRRSSSQRRARLGAVSPPSPASSHSKCCSLC